MTLPVLLHQAAGWLPCSTSTLHPSLRAASANRLASGLLTAKLSGTFLQRLLGAERSKYIGQITYPFRFIKTVRPLLYQYGVDYSVLPRP